MDARKVGFGLAVLAMLAAGACRKSEGDRKNPGPESTPVAGPVTSGGVNAGRQSEGEGKNPGSEIKPVAVAVTSGGLHEDWKNVPLEDAVQKGLKWLVSVQGSDGGWGQDGGVSEVVRKDIPLESQGNDVANTAMVCLALMRAGNTPSQGPYREALDRGIRFILANVEESPADGLPVTKRTGTQIQRKLGPNIDTFLANLVLAEADGRVADAEAGRRVHQALEKCVAKIQKNQGKDGSWNQGGGWAPVIGTSLASRGLFRAQAKGAGVQQENLDRARENALAKVDVERGEFKRDADGAGVRLYGAGFALEEASRAPAADAMKARKVLTAGKNELADATFVGGFGSMGGEEFISYMSISDSLVRAGGEEWKKWNGKIREHVIKLQNQDGTWAGHHCITGRVACTSGAVLTLLAERTAPRS
ncbi:MAG TPA: hypothetical protein VGK61_06075 [Planctomycetota bacterium]|jgi:hypothetical protein